MVQSNAWKSCYPMEILMGAYNFDIIRLQEPWQKEIEESDHTGYIHITPACDSHHRVSLCFKEATFAAADICPRPDLSISSDLLVLDIIINGRRIYLINLYNDCETRAGVGILAAVLALFAPCEKIFADPIERLAAPTDPLDLKESRIVGTSTCRRIGIIIGPKARELHRPDPAINLAPRAPMHDPRPPDEKKRNLPPNRSRQEHNLVCTLTPFPGRISLQICNYRGIALENYCAEMEARRSQPPEALNSLLKGWLR
ncbi:hypothetical protein B0H17DRAFT_1151338 [Mycena rosella]|uniref:Endonuclease/exonuclease/phosphatase domain-containing protein n=1 Tax=Mycena rosella TaxID=1033263 RepID=A0AAD7BKV5_MYCRO|nr:hypothetical protein B0H17DRAFT_1151338 [Mycena rosella]